MSVVGSVCDPPKGHMWPCGDIGQKPLFVRQCYSDLFEEAILRIDAPKGGGKSGLVLVGSPGIGKSCFLNYLLVRLLQAGKTMCAQFESRWATWIFKDGRSRACKDFSLPHEMECNPAVVHLFDPKKKGGSGPPLAMPFCIIASSPKDDNYKGAEGAFQGIFVPSDDTHGPSDTTGAGAAKRRLKALENKLYVPCWSKAEVRKHISAATSNIRPVVLENLDKLYELYGGVPRKLYKAGMKTDDWERELKRLEVIVERIDIPAALKYIRLGFSTFLQYDNMPHEVFCVEVQQDQETKRMVCERFKIGYVSEKARALMGRRISAMSSDVQE